MSVLNRPSSISDLYVLIASTTTGSVNFALPVLIRSQRPPFAASASCTCTHHWVAHRSAAISWNGVTPRAFNDRARSTISLKVLGTVETSSLL
jgi:hypothetical protein